MNRPAGTPRRRAAALALVCAAFVASQARPALADSGVPYSDPGVTGVITLCSPDGKAITTGSTHDVPFVGVGTTTTAAPSSYQGIGRTATLFAFQPRSGVAAGSWSGQTLGASSQYGNPAQPTAALTTQDPALDDFLSSYPPQVNDLIQLRMLFGAPDMPTETSTYPALDVQISADGNTWTALETGSAPCADAMAVSSESRLPSPAASASASSTPAGVSGSPGAAAATSRAPFGTVPSFTPSGRPSPGSVPGPTGTARNLFGLQYAGTGPPVPVGDDDPDTSAPSTSAAATGTGTGAATGAAAPASVAASVAPPTSVGAAGAVPSPAVSPGNPAGHAGRRGERVREPVPPSGRPLRAGAGHRDPAGDLRRSGDRRARWSVAGSP